jgi:heme exporter protein D
MNWASWSDFWGMGGHGLYVWGSYTVALTLIVLEIVMLRLRRRGALQAVAGGQR